MNICLITLGCAKNIVISDKIAAEIEKYDVRIIADANKADVLFVNTCGFIQSAIEENFGVIEQIQQLKHNKHNVHIVVFGCMVKRFENSKELRDLCNIISLNAKFPLVDTFLPYSDENTMLRYIGKMMDDTKQKKDLPPQSNLTNSHISDERKQNENYSNEYYTYLKISDGCNRKCAFCTIPSIKGRYKSVPQDILINEAENAINSGKKEIVLLGQETTNYGIDLVDTNIVSLVGKLTKNEDLKWLRLMYCHPSSFDLNLLKLMNDRHNFLHYIDIPLQHISDNILRKMRRNTTERAIKTLIERMRIEVSDICIRTTFMVGFPGETDNDFKMLLNFINEYELERVGVFSYSDEVGTHSHTLEGHISDELKQERLNAIMAAQQKISLKKNKAILGKTAEVLIEEKYDGGYYRGRTRNDAPDIDNSVFIATKLCRSKNYKIGDIVEVRINKASEYDLFVE